MANIFDSIKDKNSLLKLQNLVNEDIKKTEENDKIEKENREKKYRSSHIFHSYEEALDWMKHHPYKGVYWYLNYMYWDELKQKYYSREQKSDYDGINFWEEVHFYDKEELINKMDNHIQNFKKKYGEEDFKKYFFDEYGTMENVYVL